MGLTITWKREQPWCNQESRIDRELGTAQGVGRIFSSHSYPFKTTVQFQHYQLLLHTVQNRIVEIP